MKEKEEAKKPEPKVIHEAIVMAHWPGQDTPACEAHWHKLLGLAKVMGFELTGTTITPGTKLCKNCENEAEGIDPEKVLPSTY